MRIEKLQQLLNESGKDAIIIKNRENKKYFGSLGGSGIYLVVTPSSQVQFFDGRYRQEIKDLTNGFENVEVPQGSLSAENFRLAESTENDRFGD